MRAIPFIAAVMLALTAAQTPARPAVPVTPDNFVRAETDWYFGMFQERSGIGRFYHYRQLPPVDGPGVRPNRDTRYSEAVFDLDAGAVTITLPDPGPRFVSMMIVDEDHYVRAVYYGNPSWDKGWIGSGAAEDSTKGGVR